MPPLISFCIPTHNMGRYIGTAVESILRQGGDVEVVIVDGASTDDTADILADLSLRHPKQLFVETRPRNGGVDHDLARAVELARGKYMWLMSADDALREGAVAAITRALAGADILLMNRIRCNLELAPLQAQHWHCTGFAPKRIHGNNQQELYSFFKASRSLGALFSFISCIVFRRQIWDQHNITRSYCFGHAERLWLAVRRGASLSILKEPWVLARGDNDSFAKDGQLRRFLIDINGFDAIADAAFGDLPHLQAAFRAVVRREHPWFMLVSPFSMASPTARLELMHLLARFSYSPSELRLASLLASQPLLVNRVRRVRRRLRAIHSSLAQISLGAMDSSRSQHRNSKR